MNYDLFQTYHDLFLPKEERKNMLRHGISAENMRKLRTGSAGDKDTSDAQTKLPWQRCITPNIASRLTTRF